MSVEMGSVHEQRRLLLHGIAGAALLALILYLTNPYFSILEDETSIIQAANAPIAQTLHLFAIGEGQHEHPPLSDLLLHLWLPIAGLNPSLVRLPSILFYAIALLVFAWAAQKLAGANAFYATLILGMLWPFGFHFGRLAGWYSFCFLLTGLLTLSYLHFLESPTWGRRLLLLCVAFAAVASNYFCWLIIALIVLDLFLTLEFHVAWRYAVVGLTVLSAAYGPLWTTLSHEIQRADLASVGHNFPGTVLNAGFNFYALFVSESVAPWFWVLSVPAATAIGVVLVATVFLIEGHARRFYFYFLALFGTMAAIGIIGTKRLLFISGWLLVAIGCALANSKHPRLRGLLAVSLLFTVAIGWTGIFSRKHYAALHYIEPWAVLAKQAAQKINEGQVVVSNSPSFLFYLNASMHELRPSPNDRPGWASGPGVISLLQSDLPVTLPSGDFMFVCGVNTSATKQTAQAEEQLMSQCRLESTDRLLRDDGFDLKRRYFHIDIDAPYRIRVEHFDCRHSSSDSPNPR